MTFLMHCGSNEATREQVANVATPAATGTHFPMPHAELLERTLGALEGSGLTVQSESHAIQDRAGTPGANYFGLLDVQPEINTFGDDHGLAIGFRNSHCMDYAAALVCGTRVFVCDNLSFNGEIMLTRRHTRHMMKDLDRLVADAFGKLLEHHDKIEAQIEQFKDHDMTNSHLHDVVCRGLRANAFPGNAVPKILDAWYNPPHEEFEPRTAWSAFNAVTEVAKGWKCPNLKASRTRRFHALLATQCGDLAV